MAEVASAPENAGQFLFEPARVEWLEQQIMVLGNTVQMPGEFILPGDSKGGAALSVARAVVRRAERRLVELRGNNQTANQAVQQYINRLSSLLFVLEIIENDAAGKETTKAKAQS
jgi:cob(I)alamin adenosyltransferase